jgi:hypothetical protein
MRYVCVSVCVCLSSSKARLVRNKAARGEEKKGNRPGKAYLLPEVFFLLQWVIDGKLCRLRKKEEGSSFSSSLFLFLSVYFLSRKQVFLAPKRIINQ